MASISSCNIRQKKQSGAVLMTALVLLVIMTMLGITSMTTSTLEEKMAANSQDINRSFQTAESGLELAFSDEDAFNTSNTTTSDGTAGDVYTPSAVSIGSYDASVTFNAVMLQAARPPRNSGWDTSNAFYHFDLDATSITLSGSTTTVHGGAYQIGKK